MILQVLFCLKLDSPRHDASLTLLCFYGSKTILNDDNPPSLQIEHLQRDPRTANFNSKISLKSCMHKHKKQHLVDTMSEANSGDIKLHTTYFA